MGWSAGWLALAGGAVALEVAALVKNRNGTLSANLERLTQSRMNKAIGAGAMFGLVAWFSVHLGLI